jgi:O-antigen/teichoic acid export membrane protein
MNSEISSIRIKAKAAIIFIWATLILNSLFSVASYFVEDLHATDSHATYIMLITLLSILSFTNFIISVSMFIRWFYTSYANLHTRVKELQYKKYWAVLGWFVPIVNFIVPYKIMEEMHIKTAELLKPSDIKSKIEKGLFDFWWGLGIVSTVLETLVVVHAVEHNIKQSMHMHSLDIMTVSYVFSFIVIFSLAAITTKIINDYTKAWEQILAQEQVTQGEL